jgi:hypothetical protein
MKPFVPITSAKYLNDYKLAVAFADGTKKNIDLGDFMRANKYAIAGKFINKELFKQVRVEDGTICWGNNEFDINPSDIYNGNFDIDAKLKRLKNIPSPKTFCEYNGIELKLYFSEYPPIHVHAVYNGASVKVSFFIKEGKIYRTTYSDIKGKFPPAQLKQLKAFIANHKYEIIQAYVDAFVLKK